VNRTPSCSDGIIIRTRKGEQILIDGDRQDLAALTWYVERSTGYARTDRSVNNKTVCSRMHRLVLGGIGAGLVIDHINGNKLDNRRANLRAVPQNINAKNRKRGRGVSQAKNGRWEAYAWDHNKKIWLGFFTSEEQAAAVAKSKRDELMSLYGV
jgi:hypothetical protein